MHGISISFDGVSYRPGCGRLAVFADEFAGEIAGEVAHAVQACGQRDR